MTEPVDLDAFHAAWNAGEYYPLPCAQCGKKMLRTESTAVYPFEGMVCTGCAKACIDKMDEYYK